MMVEKGNVSGGVGLIVAIYYRDCLACRRVFLFVFLFMLNHCVVREHRTVIASVTHAPVAVGALLCVRAWMVNPL